MNEVIKNKYKVTGKGMNVITKKSLVWVKKVAPHDMFTIPEGTRLEVFFNELKPDRVVFEYQNDGVARAIRIVNFNKKFSGKKLNGVPSMRSLEKMSNDGIASTPTGCRTEPDGYGEDGSPSWLLVLGYI